MPWKKRIWPIWARTVGAMIRQGAIVRVHCRQCRNFFDVDLVAVQRARGKDHCLIDGSTNCRISSCRGRGYFLAARDMAATFLLLIRADMVQREELEQIRPLDIEPPSPGPLPPEAAAQVAA